MNAPMNRRAFLNRLIATGVVYGTGGLPFVGSSAYASFAPVSQPVLADLMLLGGPNLRHLLVPAYNGNRNSYGYRYWQATARMHSLPYVPAEYAARWNDDYFHQSSGGVEFGILKSSGWLKTLWDEGKLAIVANAYGAATRDHEHCTMVLDQGNASSGPNDSGRSGWGGRLATTLGANVVAMTDSPRPFCFGPDPNDLNSSTDACVVNAGDTRNFNLYHPTLDEASRWSDRARVARALKSYYAAKGSEMSTAMRARRVVDLEQKIRLFGQAIDDRLASVTIPEDLLELYSGNSTLRNRGFGVQLRNLYDSLACNDILNMRVASLDYGGWDTHKDQRGDIEGKLGDIFGRFKGIHTLHNTLPADARASLVWVVAGEFGRQIRDNGDQGTDHGIGNYVLVFGERVKGGIYGDMFPENEIGRLEEPSPDIAGLTSFDHVFGRVCDHLLPGAGSTVFPQRATRPLEAGVNFGAMF